MQISCVYPNELLPKRIYKSIIETDNLPNGASILRKQSCDARKNFDVDDSATMIEIYGLKNISSDSGAKYQEALKLSLNLNSIFQFKHLGILVKDKELHKYWNNEMEDIGSADVQCDLEENVLGFFMLIDKVHNKEFPFEKNVSQKTTQLKGKILVVHRPTKCNYWHFEFEVQDTQSNFKLKPNDSAWVKSAAESIFNFYLKKHLKRKSIEPCKVDAQVYYT